ncbi:chromate reductase, Class I, flavoprotein [Candidatus Mancarchaeum acidiphilum]|uniref:Chromate reductase, Class I, flavoprotein n=1 Tax=Candidatus Mancarchaeum acidiphilum TaxID=1920749 RepID=A0A218NP03_9ARCH|nr:NADPH-dependent FMN reductase [Candidatus Mancarchaeum acidiphilum]ASI14193.1 chromate reductase, Class I, flavoprotein [Candidatus Mancarchaeum acidiphilum]
MENSDIVILGICGSLRKDSYNRVILNAAAESGVEGVKFKFADIGDLPLYNQDLDNNLPEPVKRLKHDIESADALLIVTPEYNRSVPGPLKNAIDWASRPYGKNSFDEKPVAVLGATVGRFVGTALVQYHLRGILAFMNAHLMENPQMFITEVGEKVKDGKLVDEETKEGIKKVVDSLKKWAIRIAIEEDDASEFGL